MRTFSTDANEGGSSVQGHSMDEIPILSQKIERLRDHSGAALALASTTGATRALEVSSAEYHSIRIGRHWVLAKEHGPQKV